MARHLLYPACPPWPDQNNKRGGRRTGKPALGGTARQGIGPEERRRQGTLKKKNRQKRRARTSRTTTRIKTVPRVMTTNPAQAGFFLACLCGVPPLQLAISGGYCWWPSMASSVSSASMTRPRSVQLPMRRSPRRTSTISAPSISRASRPTSSGFGARSLSRHPPL